MDGEEGETNIPTKTTHAKKRRGGREDTGTKKREDFSRYLGGVEPVRHAKIDEIRHARRVEIHMSPQTEGEQCRFVDCPDQQKAPQKYSVGRQALGVGGLLPWRKDAMAGSRHQKTTQNLLLLKVRTLGRGEALGHTPWYCRKKACTSLSRIVTYPSTVTSGKVSPVGSVIDKTWQFQSQKVSNPVHTGQAYITVSENM